MREGGEGRKEGRQRCGAERSRDIRQGGAGHELGGAGRDMSKAGRVVARRGWVGYGGEGQR